MYELLAEKTMQKIVSELDAERATGYCDEMGIIKFNVGEVLSVLSNEIRIRDDEIKMLKEVYQKQGKRGLTAEKKRMAIKLNNSGKSYREIAADLGWKSPSTAFKAVKGSP